MVFLLHHLGIELYRGRGFATKRYGYYVDEVRF